MAEDQRDRSKGPPGRAGRYHALCVWRLNHLTRPGSSISPAATARKITTTSGFRRLQPVAIQPQKGCRNKECSPFVAIDEGMTVDQAVGVCAGQFEDRAFWFVLQSHRRSVYRRFESVLVPHSVRATEFQERKFVHGEGNKRI